jgi:glyoxylase-like metal-dependent hydrolase (beta-lactamase superfamily II)
LKIGQLHISCIVSEPFSENTYLLWLSASNGCLVVDPGLEPSKIVDKLDQERLTPVAILNTHGHSDHIAGNAAMKSRWPDCPLIIGRNEADKLTDPFKNLSAMVGLRLVSPPADRTVEEGDRLSFAGMDFVVHETPGHSRGHVIFVWNSTDPWVVLGGDVLFRESIGRTDFPDGSFPELARSIKLTLFTMPDSTIVLPGHGPETTIGYEREHNPFVGRSAG